MRPTHVLPMSQHPPARESALPRDPRSLDRLLRALGIRYWLETDRPQVARSTSDLVHSRCSAYVGRRLETSGWIVHGEVEVGGDRSRGWIDLLAYHQTTKVLLVIEVKTE